jgi:hypothetical protein
MQLEELRMNKKMGEDDPALIAEIGKQKLSLEAKHEALLRNCRPTGRPGMPDRSSPAPHPRNEQAGDQARWWMC